MGVTLFPNVIHTATDARFTFISEKLNMLLVPFTGHVYLESVEKHAMRNVILYISLQAF